MKRKISVLALAGLSLLTTACFDDMFGPVTPIAPSVTTGAITNALQTSFKISGTISDPSYENARQRKKSGRTVEHGFAYGTSDNPAEGIIRKTGDTITTFPHRFEATITGLRSNTAYKVWAYAKTEAGVTVYGNEAGQKTNDFPDPDPTITITFPSSPEADRAPTMLLFETSDKTPGARYVWEFSDGGTSTDKNPKRNYTIGGNQSVKLTISANGKVKSNLRTFTIKKPYTRVQITSITLLNYSQFRQSGSSWDLAGAGNVYQYGGNPDVMIRGYQVGVGADFIYSHGGFIQDITPSKVSAGSVKWSIGGSDGFYIYSPAFSTGLIRITLYDSDNGDPTSINNAEYMGSVPFRIGDFQKNDSKKYLNVVDASGDNADYHSARTKMRLNLQWSE